MQYLCFGHMRFYPPVMPNYGAHLRIQAIICCKYICILAYREKKLPHAQNPVAPWAWETIFSIYRKISGLEMQNTVYTRALEKETGRQTEFLSICPKRTVINKNLSYCSSVHSNTLRDAQKLYLRHNFAPAILGFSCILPENTSRDSRCLNQI